MTTAPAIQAFFANPVVVRDLRAQMRGTKSYWYQGAYLLLLSVLAVTGYMQAVKAGMYQTTYGGDGMPLTVFGDPAAISVVDVQGRLEGFYNFIFLTLAGLVTLIAPALTAASITGERQRLSLDLLVTTPMTAFELLVGKLLSSVAFLGLLLALSLPASALCVLLGGATIADVFRIYLLLATDGVVLSAIGLYFSCAARTNLAALAWTYTAVVGFLAATYLFGAMGTSGQFGAVQSAPGLAVAVALLNPFLAVLPLGQGALFLGPVGIPLWIGAAALAFLGMRLLITAASYRLGLYGGAGAVSLRYQTLVVAGIAAFAFAHQSALLRDTGPDSDRVVAAVAGFFVLLFVFALPFLPGLFVPAKAEDAPPGLTESEMPDDPAPYRVRRALLPTASGALPYFHLWLGVSLACYLVGHGLSRGGGDSLFHVFPHLIGVGFYLSGVGFLLWSVSRLAAVWARGLSAARASACALFVAILALPALAMSMTEQGDWANSPVAPLWMAYPLIKLDDPGMMVKAGLTGTFAYGLGFLMCVLRRRVAPPGDL